MDTGTKVILKEEYNDYPIGTVAIYLYSRSDSGTYAAIVALDDDRLKEEMKGYRVKSIKELVKRAESNLSLLECSLTTFRPTERMIVSLDVLEKEIKEHQKALKNKIVLAAKLREASTPLTDCLGGDNFNKAIVEIKKVFVKYKIITPVYAERNNIEICLLDHMGKYYEYDLSRDLIRLTGIHHLGTITIGVQKDSNQRKDENTVIS